jgi:protease I
MRNVLFRNGKLQGKKIAMLAADGFEYLELSIPSKALWFAGATRHVIAPHGGRVRGMNLTEPTRTKRVHRTLEEADPADYDALLVPGGFIGPDFLRQSAKARAFVRAFADAQKPIASLCHGPWLLASAGVLEGRRLTSWPGIRDDLVHAGAIWRNEALVVDGNLITSRGPQDLATFVPAMIELFATGHVEREQASESDSSPQAEEPLQLAMRAARLLPGPSSRAVLGIAAAAFTGAWAFRRA